MQQSQSPYHPTALQDLITSKHQCLRILPKNIELTPNQKSTSSMVEKLTEAQCSLIVLKISLNPSQPSFNSDAVVSYFIRPDYRFCML